MKKIYLDDFRTPTDKTWIVVRNFEKFKSALLQLDGEEFVVSFDHDLHPDHYDIEFEQWKDSPIIQGLEPTGYDCAVWMIENNIFPSKWYVHSANRYGGNNIIAYLKSEYAKQGIEDFGGYKTFWSYY